VNEHGYIIREQTAPHACLRIGIRRSWGTIKWRSGGREAAKKTMPQKGMVNKDFAESMRLESHGCLLSCVEWFDYSKF
jgi:hypothetical protein